MGALLDAIAHPQPTVQAVNPQDAALKRQALLAGQQEIQQKQLQTQQLQQQIQDVATTRQFAAKHNGDWDAILKDPDYLSQVNPNTALGIQKSVVETADKIADTKQKVAAATKAQADADESHANLIGDLASRAKESGYSLPVIDSILTQMEQVDPKNAQHTEQIRQVIAQDPTQAPALIDGFITAAQQQKIQTAQLAAQKEAREAATAQVTGEETKAKTAAALRDAAIKDSTLVTDQASFDQWAQAHPDMAKEVGGTYDPQKIALLQRSAIPVEKQPEFDIKSLEAQAMKSQSPADDVALVKSVTAQNPALAGPLTGLIQGIRTTVKNPETQASLVAAALKDAVDQQGRTRTAIDTERAEAPDKLAAAVAAARAMSGTGPTANVPPHLAPAAIAAYNKSGEALAQAQTVSDDIQKVLDLAGAGNKAAGANVPMLGVGAVNAVNGIKRINSAEIAQYGSAGSLVDKIQGRLQGWVEGQPIPADVLKDMKSLHDTLAESALARHSREVQSINNSYGANFKPMKFETVKPASASGIANPQNKAEYDALPSGAHYMKNGQEMVKQ
jgi:hypothetical protein